MLGREPDAEKQVREPDEWDELEEPVMPAPPPFPAFTNRPSLPHQPPGNGFESGRDSRAR